MSDGRGDSLQVRRFYQKAKIPLELSLASGHIGFSRLIKKSSLSGHADSIPVPLWGKREIQKLERMASDQRKNHIRKKLQNIPCLILTDGLSFPRSVRWCATENKIALFRTEFTRSKTRIILRRIFSSLAPAELILSGGLLNMFGHGILIMGDSGVGKSESALELISRGHLFIADDVVQIRINGKGDLIGAAVPLSRNFMEIRGLGIINIQKIFGDKSIRSKAKIDLIIMLKRWKTGKEYDRLGLKYPESLQLLGVAVPKISIPVAPGRNIATLIEVACKVFMLKKSGYHAAREITEKLDRALAIR
jgi:HPr kinase/phosphorylase